MPFLVFKSGFTHRITVRAVLPVSIPIMEEFAFNYRDQADALGSATGHRSNLAGSVGALEVSPRSAMTRTKVNNDTSALDKAVAKANTLYQLYATMDGPAAGDLATSANDCTNMYTAATTARNKAITALATAKVTDAQPQNAHAAAVHAGPDSARNAEALKQAKLLTGASHPPLPGQAGADREAQRPLPSSL